MRNKITILMVLFFIINGFTLINGNDKKVKMDLLEGAKEVLPFFALQQEAHQPPQTALTKQDIRLLINRRNVRDFSLEKVNMFAPVSPELTGQDAGLIFSGTIFSYIDKEALKEKTLTNAKSLAKGLTAKATDRLFILPVNSLKGLKQRISKSEGRRFLYLFTSTASKGHQRKLIEGQLTTLLKQGNVMLVVIDIRDSSPGSTTLVPEHNHLYLSGNVGRLKGLMEGLFQSYYEIVFPNFKDYDKGSATIRFGSNREAVQVFSYQYLSRAKSPDRLVLVQTTSSAAKAQTTDAAPQSTSTPTYTVQVPKLRLERAGGEQLKLPWKDKKHAFKKLDALRNNATETANSVYYEYAIKSLKQGRPGQALHYLQKIPHPDTVTIQFIDTLSQSGETIYKMLAKLDTAAKLVQKTASKLLGAAAPAPAKKRGLKAILNPIQAWLRGREKQTAVVMEVMEQLPAQMGFTNGPLFLSAGDAHQRLRRCGDVLGKMERLRKEGENPNLVQEGQIDGIIAKIKRIIANDATVIEGVNAQLQVLEKIFPAEVGDFVMANSQAFDLKFRLPYFKKRLPALGVDPESMNTASFFNVVLHAGAVKKNKQGYWEARFGNHVTLVYIPAGPFVMGLPWETGGADDESPHHTVSLEGYWIAKYETTFRQYDQYSKALGNKQMNDYGRGRKKRPVVGVSWDNAREYCRWLSRQTGLNAALPSEAQWEKAARGMRGGQYPWGNSKPGAANGNFADSRFLAKYKELNPPENKAQKLSLQQWMEETRKIDDGYIYTAPVGSYPAGASPYGVMDMAGNVWEWVYDAYDDDYYHRSPRRNPVRSSSGGYKVARGGSWDCHTWLIRSTGRAGCNPKRGNDTLGFRVVVNAN